VLKTDIKEENNTSVKKNVKTSKPPLPSLNPKKKTAYNRYINLTELSQTLKKQANSTSALFPSFDQSRFTTP
jgi:hypothetical protein